ncbi:MAG: hypothetical protein H6983_22310 [Ectothiorhodospiraceae bacterium]|nr:hypothetical protein [Ectothiorhodospiraceae bacterium]
MYYEGRAVARVCDPDAREPHLVLVTGDLGLLANMVVEVEFEAVGRERLPAIVARAEDGRVWLAVAPDNGDE